MVCYCFSLFTFVFLVFTAFCAIIKLALLYTGWLAHFTGIVWLTAAFFHVTWTTVTHSFTSYLTDWRRGSMSGVGCLTACHQCYIHFRSGWTLRWQPQSTVSCPAWLQLTWLLNVSWSLMSVIVSCILWSRGYVPKREAEADASWLPIRSCGTAFQFIWANGHGFK